MTSSAAYTQGHIKSDIAFFSLYRMLKISIISQEYNTANVIFGTDTYSIYTNIQILKSLKSLLWFILIIAAYFNI